MGLFKSIGKAVTKPFKQVGKAVHWTSWAPAALSAVGGGVVGLGAYYMNQQSKIAREQINAQYSLASQEAERLAAAQNVPVIQASAAPQATQSAALADADSAADWRRRYSLQRTVNNYSLRSSLGGGNKYSLG